MKRILLLLLFTANIYTYSAVTVTQSGNDYIIDNGIVAVKVPANNSGGTPAPIKQIKVNGNWYGSGTITLQNGMTLNNFNATQLSDGVRLQYLFQSCLVDSPYLDITIKVKDGTGQIYIEETYRMGTGSFYSFEASSGWSPTEIKAKTWYWSNGSNTSPTAGSGDQTLTLQPRERFSKTLEPLRMFSMQPRWTQNGDNSYFISLQNTTTSISVGVCKASKWYFPHDSYIWGRTVTGGGKLFLDFPTQRGGRYYVLIAGDATTFASAHSILDAHQSYTGGPKFYDGNWGNPTGGTVRGTGRNLITSISGGTLPSCNAQEILNLLNRDFWGYPGNQWSSINPNFYTDLVRVPALKACGCKNDPKFAEIKQKLEEALLAHFETNFVLPGGAGECPGYHKYALEESDGIVTWAPLVKQHVGIDILNFPTVIAGRAWLTEVGRTPQGDTHPTEQWKGNQGTTKEYPHYGVVFVGNAGTLDWKAGPMRGHYHGDQLSFHWWGEAIDHQVSYSPRADQEHVHNRVAFKPTSWSYANMDGYERIIAFKTSSNADVSIGQVESNRFRQQPQLPDSYIWQANLQEQKIDSNLAYRRTMVMVKTSNTYFVIRDQSWSGMNMNAMFAIHAKSSSDASWSNNKLSFSNMAIYFAKPQFGLSFTKFNYDGQHSGGSTDPTKGAFITSTGKNNEFISVMWSSSSIPTCTPVAGGVQVGSDIILFADPTSDPNSAVVTVNGTVILTSSDVDLNRSQGYGYLDKGRAKWDGRVYVPEAGYPMGPMPEWLLSQRVPGYKEERSVCTNQLILAASIINVSCGLTNNGAINLSVSNGTTPYTYSWSNGATTQNISNLTVGNYSVTVSDAGSKTKTATYSIASGSGLTINSSITHVSSQGGVDGAITLTVTGGTTPYTYTWSNGKTTISNLNLTANSYSVTVTDVNSCSAIGTFTVNEIIDYDIPIHRTNTAPTIDGTIEALWNNVSYYNLSNNLLGTPSASNLSVKYKCLWDNSYLYVLAEVTDDNKSNDGGDNYQNDGIEVYIDINNDKATTYGANDYQYGYLWNGNIYENKHTATTNVTGSQINTATGYIMELRFAWSTLGLASPAIGIKLGFDIHCNDDDAGGNRENKIAWKAIIDDSWQNPSLFGTAKLTDVISYSQEEQILENALIYPNPVNNYLFIPGLNSAIITVKNMVGVTIKTITLNSYSVNLSDLKSGIYILEIKSGTKTRIEKIIKE